MKETIAKINKTKSCFFEKINKINKPLVDRKSTRLNSSHTVISYAVFCLKKKTKKYKHVEAKQYMTK